MFNKFTTEVQAQDVEDAGYSIMLSEEVED